MERRSVNCSSQSQIGITQQRWMQEAGGQRIDGRSSSKENFKGRKMIVEELERQRRKELQKHIDDRLLRVTKYLNEKQQNNMKQIAMKQSKSNQWLQQQKATIQNSAQISQRDFNQSFRTKQIQTIYFNQKNKKKWLNKQAYKKQEGGMDPLPSIRHEKQHDGSQSKLSDPNLVDFGIFTARSDMVSFLRRLRSTIEHEFKGGLDVDNVFDLNRLQYHLLHEIRSEGK